MNWRREHKPQSVSNTLKKKFKISLQVLTRLEKERGRNHLWLPSSRKRCCLLSLFQDILLRIISQNCFLSEKGVMFVKISQNHCFKVHLAPSQGSPLRMIVSKSFLQFRGILKRMVECDL